MSTPAVSVVQREATWLTAQPGVTGACGPVLPYVRRQTGTYDRRVTLRRLTTRVRTWDSGSDHLDHDLLLIVSWPVDSELVGAQTYLDDAVDLLVATLRANDRTHGGLWLNSADGGESGLDDVTVTFSDPDEAVALADDGRLVATVAYSVTEQVNRPA